VKPISDRDRLVGALGGAGGALLLVMLFDSLFSQLMVGKCMVNDFVFYNNRSIDGSISSLLRFKRQKQSVQKLGIGERP
jgi:hypothetical protein